MVQMMSRSKRKNCPKDPLLYPCPISAIVKWNKFSGFKYKFILTVLEVRSPIRVSEPEIKVLGGSVQSRDSRGESVLFLSRL